MSRPPMRPAVDGHNGRPISWPSHPTRTRSARHGFGPPLGPAGREAAVIATLAAPLHRPTASIRAATRRTAMPSAGEAEGGGGRRRLTGVTAQPNAVTAPVSIVAAPVTAAATPATTATAPVPAPTAPVAAPLGTPTTPVSTTTTPPT